MKNIRTEVLLSSDILSIQSKKRVSDYLLLEIKPIAPATTKIMIAIAKSQSQPKFIVADISNPATSIASPPMAVTPKIFRTEDILTLCML